MSIVLPVQREHQKAVIRRFLVFNPNISVRQLKIRLEEAENPMSMGELYLGELVHEIRLDRIREVEEETKEELYARMSDLVEYVNQQLRAIANEEKLEYTKLGPDGKPSNSPETRIFAQNNRIKALVAIIQNTEKLLNMRMDLGLLERKLGTASVRVLELLALIDHERNHPAITSKGE